MHFFCVAMAAAMVGPVTNRLPHQTATTIRPLETFVCDVCGHVYNASVDGPSGCKAADPPCSTKPNTPFEDLPDGWVCPQCGAPKSSYGPQLLANGETAWVHRHHDEAVPPPTTGDDGVVWQVQPQPSGQTAENCIATCNASRMYCKEGVWPGSADEFSAIVSSAAARCGSVTSGEDEGNPAVVGGECYWNSRFAKTAQRCGITGPV